MDVNKMIAKLVTAAEYKILFLVHSNFTEDPNDGFPVKTHFKSFVMKWKKKINIQNCIIYFVVE